MKLYIKYFFLLSLCITIFSCGDDPSDPIVYPEQDVVRNDAFTELEVFTPVVSFQAGIAAYDVSFEVTDPDDLVSSVNVYKSFEDALTGEVTDRVFVANYPNVAGEVITRFEDSYTPAQLKEGLTIAGAPLPENDVDIAIGSSWFIDVELVDGSDNVISAESSAILIGVLSRFAGRYTVTESNYFRIGVESGPFNGTEIFIGSIDEFTFSHDNNWGPFAYIGRWVFVLNDDNTITIPDSPDQLTFTGDDHLTCPEDGSFFTNVPCEGSNVLIPDDAGGKHIIKLTYGYFTASGDDNEGPREFYEVLEKIVD